jgi:hypothetical protein
VDKSKRHPYADHLLVQYAEQVWQEVQADVEMYPEKVFHDPTVGRHGEYAQVLISQLYRVRLETARLSEQLLVAVDKIAEIQHLARVCVPEVLAEQLQDLLDDSELLEQMAYPRLREQDALRREETRCPLD